MATPRAGFGGANVRTPRVAGDPGDELGASVAAVKAAAKGARASRSRKASQASRTRGSRDQSLRGAQDLHEASDAPWTPPTSLDAPPPRTGFKQKWVRFAVFGRDDARNLTQKMREGWLPRAVSTVPKGFHVPTMRSGPMAGAIVVEGMVLCEIPAKKAAQRNAHYLGRARKMAEDIERNIQRVNRALPTHAGFGRITKLERSIPVREVGELQEADA